MCIRDRSRHLRLQTRLPDWLPRLHLYRFRRVRSDVYKRQEGRNEVQTNYINKILKPTNAMEGDAVPVSVFVDNANGSIPSGTAAYEKRGIAVDIPKWDPDKCCLLYTSSESDFYTRTFYFRRSLRCYGMQTDRVCNALFL